MKFMYVSTVPVAPAEIVNDDDVKFFIGENCSEANLRTPLCVTLERRTLLVEPVDYEDGSSQTFNGTEENELGFCFNNEREDDDVGTSSGLLALEDSPIEPQVGTGHPQSTDNATLVDPVTPVCPFTPVAAVAPTAPRSSQPGDSHKPVEWVTTKEDLIASFNIHKKQASSARHHRQANKLRIESLIRSKCQAMNGKYSPIDIIKDVQIEFGVKLTYPQAWRARDSVVNSDSGPDEQCQSELSSERPKKRREPLAEEDRPTQRNCGNCGIIGHNHLTCQMYIEQHPSTSSGGAEECT
ncbi:hypothetical protein TIFTF001_002025 [Ficus carica]|uniref:Uncharacterized protein n=1 Tax=Ficus carica TaxID=3494 RepID=A0AA88D691_FICCA|nr:hypothetical protein TIFTF001_002025 [Ficus carica]